MNSITKDFYMPILLVMPMISHWVLPSGMEQRLTFTSSLFVYYYPNICYLLYFICYKKSNSATYIGTGLKKKASVILSVCWIYALINTLLQNGNDIALAMNNCLNWIYLSLLFIRCPLNYKQIENTKYFIIPTLLFLCLEYIVFSTGLLTYQAETGNDISGVEYSGIMRISSTIGGSTGTAIILCILGIICSSCYKLPNKLIFISIIISTIAIFFTVSRSSIILWVLYLFILFYYRYFHSTPLYKKIISVIVALGIIMALDSYGVFSPVIERSEILVNNNEVLSGRDDRRNKALEIAEDSYWLGVGAGQVFPDKSVREIMSPTHYLAPHNFYMVILSEHGIVPLIMVLLLLFTMVRKLRFSQSQNIGFLLLLIISFNSEGIIADAEFWGAVMLFYLIIKSKNESLVYMPS